MIRHCERQASFGNQMIVLGGGLEVEDGQTRLNNDSVHRVERAVEFFYDNPANFSSDGAVIVASGGNTWRGDNNFTRSEASLMEDALLDAALPAHLIKVEDESYNTLTNFLNSAEIIDAELVSPEEPVLFVTQSFHARRAKLLGSKVLDLPIEHVRAEGSDGWQFRAREAALCGVYRSLLYGIQPGDRQAIAKRYESARSLHGKLHLDTLKNVFASTGD